MLFGVFDGHGGKEVSQFAKKELKNTLIGMESFQNGDFKKSLEETFLKMDEKLKENDIRVSGSTACVVLITPDTIFCANAGDSRAVLNNEADIDNGYILDPSDPAEDDEI